MRLDPASVTEKDLDRFWSYVDVRGPDECWPWLKSFNGKNGYARFCAGTNKQIRCSRLLLFIMQGPPETSKPLALHTCDNPRCVNPLHLFYGDQLDNMRDCAAKGRNAVQVNPDIVRGVRNGMTKLTAEQVTDIKRSDLSQSALGRKYNVTKHAIWRIKHGINWRQHSVAA
jgi:hypothetical protein